MRSSKERFFVMEVRRIKSDELYHHGVKGQRWGVRRYQDYNGKRIGNSDNIVIKKRNFVRYSPTNDKKIRNSQYMSTTRHDVKRYKEDSILGVLGFKRTVEHIFKIKIENVDPITVRKGASVVNDIVSKSRSKTIKEAYETLKETGYFDPTKSFYERFDIRDKNEKTQEAINKLGSYIHNHVYKDRDAFSSKYREQGYDAIVDPEDLVWSYDMPIIVTNEKKFKVKGSREISKKERSRYKLDE